MGFQSQHVLMLTGITVGTHTLRIIQQLYVCQGCQKVADPIKCLPIHSFKTVIFSLVQKYYAQTTTASTCFKPYYNYLTISIFGVLIALIRATKVQDLDHCSTE